MAVAQEVDESYENFVQTREAERNSMVVITPKDALEIVKKVSCEKCFGETVDDNNELSKKCDPDKRLIICRKAKTFCLDCVKTVPLNLGRSHEVCPFEHECSCNKKLYNLLLEDSQGYILTEIGLPATKEDIIGKTKEEKDHEGKVVILNVIDAMEDIVLTKQELTQWTDMLNCKKCGNRFYDKERRIDIYLCKQGHSLCSNCHECECGQIRLSELLNEGIMKLCDLIRNLEPPTDLFTCRIESCLQNYPSLVFKKHVLKNHEEDICFLEGSSFRFDMKLKRSRRYRARIAYRPGARCTRIFISEKDFVHFNARVTEQYALELKVIPYILEEEPENKNAKCSIKLRKNIKEGEYVQVPYFMRKDRSKEEEFEKEFNISKHTKDEQDMDTYPERIDAKDIGFQYTGYRVGLDYFSVEIVLGKSADVDIEELRAAHFPLRYHQQTY